MEKAYNLAQSIIDNPQVGIGLIAETNGEITGVLAGVASDGMMTDSQVCTELVWWTAPGKGSPRDWLRLQQAYEYWAKYIVKAQFISVGVLEDARAERLRKIHSKRGYIKKEETWLRPLS